MATLDSKIPDGSIADKWENHKFSMKLVNPNNKRRFEIIVVGTGLAGASAAASLSDLGSGPMVVLVKSPNPEGLIQGIGAVPGILPPPLNEAALESRKLGGHTVHSFGVMELPDPSTGELVASEVFFAVKDLSLIHI